MTRSSLRTTCATLVLALLTAVAFAPPVAAQTDQANVGKQAPDFTLTSADGETYSLSDYQGSYVVLEWLNFECPFVGKHYGSGHMQELQKKYTDEADIEGATNYVRGALEAAMNGEEVSPKQAKPYGCTIKYASK